MHFPHAYKPGPNNETIRHPSGNGKPVIDYDMSRRYPETWQAMEKLVDSGKARAIGLSSFSILKTKRVLEVASIIPAVNQVEIHPYFPQHELVDFSASHGILVMAHQPLGGRPVPAVRAYPDIPPPTEHARVCEMHSIPSNLPNSKLYNSQQIIEIANKAGMSPAQVCLSWALQRGIPVVPKSVQPTHMADNLKVKRLPDDLFEAVDTLSQETGTLRFLDPSRHIQFDIFDEERDEPVANSAPWD
ncbi:NADP-dependent oxidoreductase domain containing protein [Rhypophila sp. PSN 637]